MTLIERYRPVSRGGSPFCRVPGPENISPPTYRDAAVGRCVELLTLRTSHPPTCCDAAVRAFIELLALRASHPPPCCDAAVRAFVKILALRTSHPPPCRDTAVRPFVEFLALRTSHPPPCRDTAVRPFVKFLALRTSLGGLTPPNPTHLFSTGTNTWPGGQLPCAAAGVETKFAAKNIAANIRPAPRRKPNAAVFLPMAQSPFDEPPTARSVARSRSKACLIRYSFLARP